MTDEQLMALIQAGQLHHAGELFMRYHLRVLNYLVGWTRDQILSQDVAAGTFLAIMVKCQTYNPNMPFKAWLFAIARNQRWEHQKGTILEHSPISEVPDPSPSPHDEFQEVEKLEWMSKALNSLSNTEREILALTKEGLSHQEIARIIGCKESAVKDRIYRTIRRLKAKYVALQRRGV